MYAFVARMTFPAEIVPRGVWISQLPLEDWDAWEDWCSEDCCWEEPDDWHGEMEVTGQLAYAS